MTISRTQILEALSKEKLAKFWLGYFQERFRSEINQHLLELAEQLKAKEGKVGAHIATKLGKRPEQISRWLSAPNNLESDTISDLALSMGYVPKIEFRHISSEFLDGQPNQLHEVSFYCDASKRAVEMYPSSRTNFKSASPSKHATVEIGEDA